VTSLAYISAEYPKVSHTFIHREIEALRRLGLDVHPFSIRRTPATGLLSDADRAAARETFAILPVDRGRLARAHLRWTLRHPRRYLQTLLLALRHGGSGRANPVWRAFYFAEAVLLADELRRRDVWHVHAHFVNVASAVAMLATALRGDAATWSFTMHGPLEFDDVRLHGIAGKVRGAAFVACISDFARAQLMRLVEPEYWAKLQIVHCGVEPAAYSAERLPRPAGQPLRVLSVGRLDPMKGFSVLLEALADLRDEGVALNLTLVGDGPERARLEAAARRFGLTERVRFTGALGAADVTGLLAEADLFCLPSFAEGVPVVLMEAMAAGLPVVATSVMGIPELVTDGRTGLLVSPGRPEPLAKALRRLAGHAEMRHAFGTEGRAVVQAAFDVDDAARTLQRLFAAARAHALA
jgi:glycosyltransferase involved in cell wall biosynthesis